MNAAALTDFKVRPAKRGAGRRVFEILELDETGRDRVRATRSTEHAAATFAERLQYDLDRYRAALNRGAL